MYDPAHGPRLCGGPRLGYPDTMQSGRRRLKWAVGLVALAAVATGLAASRDPAPQPLPAPTDMPAMPLLIRDLGAADRIQIVHAGTTLDLERRGQTWCLAQHGGYPVRPAMARRLIDQLLALRLTHPSAPGENHLRADDLTAGNAGLTGIRVLAQSGASLGAIVVAAHAPGARQFDAHQAGDPRDWQASGALETPVDPLAWVDPDILPIDPALVAGVAISNGAASFDLGRPDAQARLSTLAAMRFTDVHPAAQVPAERRGRLVFRLGGGGTLTAIVETAGPAVWLLLSTEGATPARIPGGDWAFRYPIAALSLLDPVS